MASAPIDIAKSIETGLEPATKLPPFVYRHY